MSETQIPLEQSAQSLRLFPALVLIVILSGSVFAYLYFFDVTRLAQTPLPESFALAVDQHHQGNTDEAIASWRQSLQETLEPVATANARIGLAYNLFVRNEHGDRSEAISLYRSVIEDPAFSPRAKVAAHNELGRVVQFSVLNGSLAFADIATLFDGELARYVANTNSEPNLVIRNIFSASNELSGNPYAQFGIASTYTSPFFSGNPGYQDESVATTLEGLVDAATPSITTDNDFGRVGEMYLSRALALLTIEKIRGEGSVPATDIEQAYKDAVEASEKGATYNDEGTAIIARFLYALFLSGTYGEARANDINELLRPLGTSRGAEHPFVKALIQSKRDVPETDLLKNRIELLRGRNISAEFESFLLANGWSAES